MTTLAEDLVILAVGLKPKTGPATGKLPIRFRFGLRGAELVTLAMAGRVAIANGRIEVRDPAPLADPALNYALGQLARSGGAEVGEWMRYLSPRYTENYFERLSAAGAISPVRVWLLLIAKRTGYVLVDQAYFHQVRMRLHTAATSTGPVDAAHAALAGLVYAAGLAPLAYPGGGANAVLRARLEQLAGGNPALAGSAAAAPRAREVPVTDDPNRWLNDQAQGTGGAGLPGLAGISAVEAAVRSASEAAVHAVISSVSEAVHAATDASSHSHHSGGSGSGDSSPSPSHHHG